MRSGALLELLLDGFHELPDLVAYQAPTGLDELSAEIRRRGARVVIAAHDELRLPGIPETLLARHQSVAVFLVSSTEQTMTLYEQFPMPGRLQILRRLRDLLRARLAMGNAH